MHLEHVVRDVVEKVQGLVLLESLCKLRLIWRSCLAPGLVVKVVLQQNTYRQPLPSSATCYASDMYMHARVQMVWLTRIDYYYY
jgi:hypothetical protein